MDLIISTPEEIRAIFNDCLKNANLLTKPEPSKTFEPEQPIPQEEALKFLGKSRQTLTTWRKKGIITGHSLGGRIYFFKSELLAAMKHSSTRATK
jgi:Helix-turn-helix domain